MRALLDVNVLIALLDSDHIHHHRATRWMAHAQFAGWASCPITQNGCIRIMSQPAYPGALPLRSVADRLGMAIIQKRGEKLFTWNPSLPDLARQWFFYRLLKK